MRILSVSAMALAIGLGNSVPVMAEEPGDSAASPLRVLDTLTVIGTAGGEENVAGSIDYLDAEALDLQGHSDILRVLRVVPGVNIQEEEGYGLRPNIGLRGSGSDRNSRIVVLEDGVPVAPAVYASPSAYYFPATARMNAVEVTKGPGVVQYGPRTSGGAIHLFSTPVPEETAGYAEILWGDYGRQRLHAWTGTRAALGNSGIDFGLMVETFQDEADGFLERESGGPDTGFDIADYVVKAALYGDSAARPWALELKYQTKDETSNQTYLGLTDADFAANPYRLYDSARNDQMVNENELFQLTGRVDLSPTTNLTAIAYSNTFARNWYKLQGINCAGAGAAGDRGISGVLSDPQACQGETFSDLDLLRGAVSLDDSIVLRANNRAYETRGISAALETSRTLAGLEHHLTIGARLHADEEDRFQKEDAYRLENGALFLTTAGPAGGTTNRLTEAEALSLYVLDRIEVTEQLQVTAGARFEDYEVTRLDYSTSDPTRADGPSRTRTTQDDVVLPSLAVLYDLTSEVQLLAGVHKGFSPAGASSDPIDNEEAWNWEVGGRYQAGSLSFEAIGFYNDYQNLLGECTNSSGGGCEPGEIFEGGQVVVYGLEATGGWDAAGRLGLSGVSVPLRAAYSWTESEFQESFESDFFGTVEAGDELNYVPTHQFTLSAGLEANRWGVNALLNAVSETRDTVGSGDIPASDVIDARTLVDLSAWYEIADGIRVKAKAENLFDETYIAARRPAGLRPGKPQEILLGVDFSF